MKPFCADLLCKFIKNKNKKELIQTLLTYKLNSEACLYLKKQVENIIFNCNMEGGQLKVAIMLWEKRI